MIALLEKMDARLSLTGHFPAMTHLLTKMLSIIRNYFQYLLGKPNAKSGFDACVS